MRLGIGVNPTYPLPLPLTLTLTLTLTSGCQGDGGRSAASSSPSASASTLRVGERTADPQRRLRHPRRLAVHAADAHGHPRDARPTPPAPLRRSRAQGRSASRSPYPCPSSYLPYTSRSCSASRPPYPYPFPHPTPTPRVVRRLRTRRKGNPPGGRRRAGSGRRRGPAGRAGAAGARRPGARRTPAWRRRTPPNLSTGFSADFVARLQRTADDGGRSPRLAAACSHGPGRAQACAARAAARRLAPSVCGDAAPARAGARAVRLLALPAPPLPSRSPASSSVVSPPLTRLWRAPPRTPERGCEPEGVPRGPSDDGDFEGAEGSDFGDFEGAAPASGEPAAAPGSVRFSAELTRSTAVVRARRVTGARSRRCSAARFRRAQQTHVRG